MEHLNRLMRLKFPKKKKTASKGKRYFSNKQPKRDEEYPFDADDCIEKMQSKFEYQLEKWSKSKSASLFE